MSGWRFGRIVLDRHHLWIALGPSRKNLDFTMYWPRCHWGWYGGPEWYHQWRRRRLEKKKRLICGATFALGVALASMAQARQADPIPYADQPLTGDILEVVPGGGVTVEADAPKFKNRDFAEGWCDGYKFAVQLVGRNRDHFMKMLAKPEVPFETHDEALKRIYASREPSNASSLVDNLVMLLRDGVDLYVVLDLGGPFGIVTLKTEDGQLVECK